ncbi:MAG: 50S ribosomal protein L6 [Methanomicrobiales archaeon]|jgi:large subunit ribosomal protein L6|nr:50S ribosomal protein L6 [Methanomicrobiales archaeon]
MHNERTVEIPAGVTATMDGAIITIEGPKGKLTRNMRYPGIDVSCDGAVFTVSTTSERKRKVAMIGTYAAHVRNMCGGVTEGYEYKMKVVYSHFPIQLKKTDKTLEIINFLGEKQPRIARISEGVTVSTGSDEVTLTGIDKELVGTTAARIERATHVRNRDPRVFQDGIYITQKA